MPRILLVKTSSLGDVVHNLPVATDIGHALPEAEIDWVVEESYSALPALHRSVRRAIPVAVRRWRASLARSGVWREVRTFANVLRAERYDAVIDTQGLFKSAFIARLAHGPRYGLDWRASREPLFLFYDRTFEVSRTLHAVERNRSLAAQALGYSVQGPADYGIVAPRGAWPWLGPDAYAVLIHATSARAKLWPEAHWTALGCILAARGVRSVLPWGSDEERMRSERLAASIPGAVTPPKLPLSDLASVLGGASCAVGVDTGLLHLAGALGVATVGIYIATDPAATGLHGCLRAVNVGGRAASPRVEEVVQALRQVSA